MRSRYQWVSLFLCSAIVWTAGCGEDATSPSEGTPPTPATLDSRVNRTNEFAMDLYGELRSAEGNLIVSPHSIVTAFGMAYAGARGATEREIAEVLHFNYPQAGFHSVLRQLNTLLEGRGASVGTDAFRLGVANSAWGEQRSPFIQSFQDTLSVNYGAPLRLVDFAQHPEDCRLAINQWVADETEDLIQELLQSGDVDGATCLVLVNAIYFRASWLYQFDPAHTRHREFTRVDGSTVNVPVMSGEMVFPYRDGDGYTAVGLPYKGEECTMLIILPDSGQFESFEASLTTAKLNSIVDELVARDVIVNLPKFSMGTRYNLIPTLGAMGIQTAFVGGLADFSGIDGTDDGIPWIDFVVHQAIISVDEYGTLAAAATGIGFTVGMPPVFDAVRPFLFVIRDDETGTLLFMGRVLDPSE